VKATDNGLLGDLADFGGFAGRENGLHGFILPLRRGNPELKGKSRKLKDVEKWQAIRLLTLAFRLVTRFLRLACVRSAHSARAATAILLDTCLFQSVNCLLTTPSFLALCRAPEPLAASSSPQKQGGRRSLRDCQICQQPRL